MRRTPLTTALLTLAMACTKERAPDDVPNVPSVAVGLTLTPADASADHDEYTQAYLRALSAQNAALADAATDAGAPTPPPPAQTAQNGSVAIDLAALLAPPPAAPADASPPEPAVTAPEPTAPPTPSPEEVAREARARAEAQRAEAQRQLDAARAAEQQRIAAARIEAQRLAAERAAEQQRIAAAQAAEVQRLAAERAAEQQRVAAERAAQARVAAERAEAQRRADAQAAEQRRLAAERAAEQRRAEARRIAAEQAEAQRIATEQAAEQRRLAAQRAAQQREAQRQAEAQRAAQEALAAQQRAEQERLAAQQRAEQQRIALQQTRAEQQRLAAQHRAEQARLAAQQRAEQERLAEQRRAAQQRAEQERLAAERAEAERLVAARAAEQQRAAQRRLAEQQRAAAELAERQRAEQERVAAERLAAEQRATQQRLAAERLAAQRRAAAEERLAAQRRAEQQHAEQLRLAAEREVQQRIAAQRLADAQRAEQQRAEQARIAAQRLAEQQRAEQQRLVAQRLAEQQRADAQRAEQQRIAAQRLAEQQRAEQQRLAAQRLAEQQRAEQQRVAAQQLAAQRLAEQQRLAAQQLAVAAPTAPAPLAAAPRRATPGAWRRLPRVPLANTRTLGRWDDPPDFDDDGLPDPIVAIEFNYGRTPCRAVASDHPCPTAAHDDAVGDGANGSLVAGFVALFSGDSEAPRGDAGVALAPAPPSDGRLLGTRRVWLSSASSPHARISTYEFSEFGPGLLVRTILDADEGPLVTDTVDVLDVFTGLGLDRRAGAIVHHCARFGTRPPTRSASFAIEDPSLTPLVWRAITSHPYSGCATEIATLDATLGQSFTGALQVRVQSTTPAGNHRGVAIAVEQGAARAVGRADRPATPWVDPLALGPVRVLEMSRGCQFDRLRFERDGHRCSVVVPRSDDPLPGCETHTSPLDPSPPRPLWLRAHTDVLLDGGVPTEPLHLVFARGGSLWETTLPLSCGRAEHRAQALPWRGGTVPAGVAVSPDGAKTLFAHGDDLWLFTRTRHAPYLLNAPGTALPRHDVRAVAFLDDTHVAAIFSGSLITFEIVVPTADDELPTSLRVDAAEIRRGLHGAAPGR